MKPNELREKTLDELKLIHKEMKEEALGLRVKHATSQLDKTHRIKEVKKDIARISTILNEKQSKER